MTQLAPNWFVEEYRSNVRHVFQSQGYKLRGLVMPEGRVEGKKVYFPVAGKQKAVKAKRGSNATPGNPDRKFVSADMQDWQVFDEIHYTDLNKMTVVERTVVQQEGAMALGRRSDRLIIDAMNLATFPAGQTTGAGADITLANLLTASNDFYARGAPTDGRAVGLLPFIWYNKLMTYKQFNSAEWVNRDNVGFINPQKFLHGKFWAGVNWLVLPEKSDDEDELPFITPAANQLQSFVWHPNCVGAVFNYTDETFIQWDNRASCWTVNMMMQGLSLRIIDKGVQRLHFASNTTITDPTP